MTSRSKALPNRRASAETGESVRAIRHRTATETVAFAGLSARVSSLANDASIVIGMIGRVMLKDWR
jgi:hypothetical protein